MKLIIWNSYFIDKEKETVDLNIKNVILFFTLQHLKKSVLKFGSLWKKKF